MPSLSGIYTGYLFVGKKDNQWHHRVGPVVRRS